MENILDLYNKPYNSKKPVICVDEKPIVIHSEKREPIPCAPGRIAKRDYEYSRKGSANVFMAIEPLTGVFKARPTKNRKAPEYAKFLGSIERAHANAKTIHLVQDNLNTHTLKSLVKYYGSDEGERIWNRFTVHYTPKHASWLNQAEIAIGIFSRQCLGKRRISEYSNLQNWLRLWLPKANRKKKNINWKFTRMDARQKFRYKWNTKGVLITR